MSSKIQVKRGLKAKLPVLDAGEPAFTTDTQEFFIGDGVNNIEFAKQSDLKTASEQLSNMEDKEKVYLTTNTGNNYSVTVPNLTALTDGYPIAVKFNAASTGAITVNTSNLGAIKVVDYFGNQVTNVRANLIANLRYESTTNSFILLGKGGGGNATASQILKDATATVDSGPLVGTMANNGAITQSLPINGSYTIPTGYHNGSGKVTQSIPTKAAATITPGVTAQTIAANQYLLGDQIIAGDADLIASNIISTANIFGVQGSASISSLGGMKTASGINTASTTTPDFIRSDVNGTQWSPFLSVSGLSFTPIVIIAYYKDSNSYGYTSLYWTFPGGLPVPRIVKTSIMLEVGTTSGGTESYDASKSPCSIVNGSFLIPLHPASGLCGKNISWIAFGN